MEFANFSVNRTWDMLALVIAVFSPLSILCVLAMTAIQKFVRPQEERVNAPRRR